MRVAVAQGAEPYVSPPRETEAGPSQTKGVGDVATEEGTEKDDDDDENYDDDGDDEEEEDTEELVSE